jgi:hypothetical protein
VRLRQIALVARNLETSVEALCAAFDIEVAFRDPGVSTFGLCNAVMPLGDTFLEVVSPVQADTSAGRLLDRRGDGGYMVIVQTDDLEADRVRMKELDVRVVWEAALDDAATIHLHPRDVGAAILSLDAMDPPASWRWAGSDWADHVRTGSVQGIVGAELQAADPSALAERWSEVLAHPARPAAAPDAWEIPLERGLIRVVPARDGRGDGLSALDLLSSDPAHVGSELALCGVRFHLVGKEAD